MSNGYLCENFTVRVDNDAGGFWGFCVVRNVNRNDTWFEAQCFTVSIVGWFISGSFLFNADCY